MRDKIEFTTPFFDSFRCNRIATTYDLELGQSRTRTIEYEIPPGGDGGGASFPWRIGVIVGPSGSGKTSVARKHYGNAIYNATESAWTNEPIIENYDKSLSFDVIAGTLTSVGFSSIPCWMQPYKTLSNGEQFRADLARALLETKQELVVFDEYTSVVDRTVAKTASFALKKTMTRNSALAVKKFVAITCHYDILPWLEPDWVLDMRTGDLSRVRLRRPKINIRIYRCKYDKWSLFDKYHYLTAKLMKNARCYIATLDGAPCAFLATIHSMGHSGARRVHRLVVLPEFQGIGIGKEFVNLIAEYETSFIGANSFLITTSNAYFARSLAKNARWTVTERNASGAVGNLRKNASIEAFVSGFGRAGRARTTLKYSGTTN